MKHIYCISGLAADHRLFVNIEVPGCSLIHLPWVPISETDDMGTYAMKMAAIIPEENPVILGLSLGGMLATEIARRMPVSKVIIVSSAKNWAEVGFNSKFLSWLNGSGIIPDFLFNRTYEVQLYFLGAHSEPEKKLLRQVIHDADPVFIRRAVHMILSWNATDYPPDIEHIHGTSDKLILPRNVKPNHWITGGTHLMILNKCDEINAIIAKCV